MFTNRNNDLKHRGLARNLVKSTQTCHILYQIPCQPPMLKVTVSISGCSQCCLIYYLFHKFESMQEYMKYTKDLDRCIVRLYKLLSINVNIVTMMGFLSYSSLSWNPSIFKDIRLLVSN